MTKKENLENETYVVEEAKQSRVRGWISSRGAKITALAVGSALALGASFTGGVVAAKTVLPNGDGPGFAERFDRDGDRPKDFDGQRPPRPGHDSAPAPATTTP